MAKLLMQTYDDNGAILSSNLYNLSLTLGEPTFDWGTMKLTLPTPAFELPPNEIVFVENLNDNNEWERSEVMPFMPSNNEGMVVDQMAENKTHTIRLVGLFTGVVSNTAQLVVGTRPDDTEH